MIVVIDFCAVCSKKRPVFRISNSDGSISVLSCYRRECVAEARTMAGFPVSGKKKRLVLPQIFNCETCRLVKDGLVASPENSVFCVNCRHNPKPTPTAKLPELFL